MWAMVTRTRTGERVAFCETREKAEERMRDSMLAAIQSVDNTRLKRAWERAFAGPMRPPSNLDNLVDGGYLDSYVHRLVQQLTLTRWGIRRVV